MGAMSAKFCKPASNKIMEVEKQIQRCNLITDPDQVNVLHKPLHINKIPENAKFKVPNKELEGPYYYTENLQINHSRVLRKFIEHSLWVPTNLLSMFYNPNDRRLVAIARRTGCYFVLISMPTKNKYGLIGRLVRVKAPTKRALKMALNIVTQEFPTIMEKNVKPAKYPEQNLTVTPVGCMVIQS